MAQDPHQDVDQQESIPIGLQLLVGQKLAGERVREETVKAYDRLALAHLHIFQAASAPLSRMENRLQDWNALHPHRIKLFASLFIGRSVVESAIEEGRYMQAQTLLRQEMETLARLVEIRNGQTKLEGERPRVSGLEESIRRLYRELSDAAHVSSATILQFATELDVTEEFPEGDVEGIRFFPSMIPDAARRLFGLHLTLWLYIVQELSIDLGGDAVAAFGEIELRHLDHAVEIMTEEGILE